MPILTSIESSPDFAVHSVTGERDHPNEDVAMRQVYPDAAFQHLSPQALGARLWSTYRILAKRFHQDPLPKDGTTASTTLVHGNTMITATLSDTVAFAAAWDSQDHFIGVKQLSRLHDLSSTAEARRIHAAGVKHSLSHAELMIEFQDKYKAQLEYGPVVYHRNKYGIKRLLSLSSQNFTTLNLPRSIGDYDFKPVVVADANIDITTIPSLLKHFNVKAFGTLLLITTSDGFTDAALYNDQSYETFLSRFLQSPFNKTNEKKLASHLVTCAATSSEDDITVSIQAIIKQNKRTDFNGLSGVYDGHGGSAAATFVAENVPLVLNELLALSNEDYAAHPDSIDQHQQDYDRDNPDSYKISLHEPEENSVALQPATSRMRFILQLTWGVLASAGIAYNIKMATSRQLLELFFNTKTVGHSLFSATCLLFSGNGTKAGGNELPAPTASF